MVRRKEKGEWRKSDRGKREVNNFVNAEASREGEAEKGRKFKEMWE